MKQCPHCKYKNSGAATYCERCGTSLQKSTLFPPDLVEYIAPPLIDFTTSTQPGQTVRHPTLQSRTFGNILTSIILYLLGAVVGSFGLFGSLLGFMADVPALQWTLLTFFISIVGLVVVLIQYRSARLSWQQRIVGVLVTTVYTFIFLIIVGFLISLQPAKTLSYAIFGGIILLYGVIVAFFALW